MRLKRKVRLKISASALRTVEHRGGLDAFLAKARMDDLSPQCQKLKREIAKAKAAGSETTLQLRRKTRPDSVAPAKHGRRLLCCQALVSELELQHQTCVAAGR